MSLVRGLMVGLMRGEGLARGRHLLYVGKHAFFPITVTIVIAYWSFLMRKFALSASHFAKMAPTKVTEEMTIFFIII